MDILICNHIIGFPHDSGTNEEVNDVEMTKK